MFQIIDLGEREVYSGVELTPNYFRGIDRKFKTHLHTIAHWTGPTNVKVEHMKDVDDVQQNLTIKSDRMQHFIIEIKNVASPLELVLIQRMFTKLVVEGVNENIPGDSYHNYLYVEGNDVFQSDSIKFERKKFSVSIAVPSFGVGLIHFAYNLDSKNGPKDVSIVSLKDILNQYSKKSQQVYEEEVREWIVNSFVDEYIDCVEDSFKAVS